MKYSPRILMILATISLLLPIHTFASNNEENSSLVLAALVNDQPIYKDQLNAKHQAKIKKYKRFNRNQEPTDEIKTMMLKSVLKEFINSELIIQASQKHPVTNLEQKVTDKINEQKKLNASNPDLKSKKINPIAIERQIRVNSYLQAHDLVNPQKPEQELKEIYEKHKLQYASKKDKVQVLHIITENKEDAVKARQLILEGQSFSDVAKQHSIDVNAASGGDLGFIEASYMPAEVDKVLFSLKKDGLSPVIKSSQGYHLVKVLNKKPAGTIPTFAQMKNFLAKGYAPKIRAQKINKHLEELKEKATIKIVLSNLQ